MKNSHQQTGKPQLLLVWSLLLGVTLISVCSGMQGTLLGLRASLEEFKVDTIGLIMSAYYIGFLLGARIMPRWVRQVGHIRVFAALATTASAVYLFMAAFTLYRMSVRAPLTAQEQSHGVAVAMQTSQVIVAEAMDETDLGNPLAPGEKAG